MKLKGFQLKQLPKPAIAWILVVMMIVSTFGYNIIFMNRSDTAKDYKAGSGSVTFGDDMYLPSDGRTPAFRTNARYKIIELVPYRGMADLGYTIGGEEPITFDNIANSDWDGGIAEILNAKESKYPNTSYSKAPGLYPLYYHTSEKRVENFDWFIKTTLRAGLDLSADEVKDYIDKHLVDVLILEPAQLNAHPELIDEADMIYCHDEGSNKIISLYQKYSKEWYGKTGLNHSYTNKFGSGCDISWEVAVKLYHFSSVSKCPLVLKGTVFRDEACSFNIGKLGLMITANEYTVWDNAFGKTAYNLYEFFKTQKNKNIWSYKKLYIALCTYLHQTIEPNNLTILTAYKSEHENESYIGELDKTTIIVTDHTSGVNGLISKKMGEDDHIKKGTKLCDTVDNDTRDVAIAIFNGQKPLCVVLDLEPDNKFSLKYSDVFRWIPQHERIFKIIIEQMTMSEFNGNMSDLNATYDIIYLGKEQDKMVKGKLYYTDNDIAAVSATLKMNALDGLATDTTNFNYSGNDITEKKADELQQFINAKYPVVCEKVINSSSTGTNIKTFIEKNTSNSSCYQTTNKVINKPIKKSQLNNGKVNVYLTLDNSVKEYKESFSASADVNNLGGLKFNTKYGDSSLYQANLYIDTNHDGLYNKWRMNSSGNWNCATDNYGEKVWHKTVHAGKAVTVNSSALIPKDALLGVVSWKLELVKLNGLVPTGVRSCKTGTLYCGTNTKAINVLQISDTGSKGLDLSKNSNFLSSAQNSIVKRDFDITTSFHDIRAPFKDIKFDDFDVFIIGFIDETKKLDNADVLLNKLNWAAVRGKGIIFTQDALSYFNNQADTKWGVSTNQRVRELLKLDPKRVCADKTISISAKDMAFTYSVLNKFSNNKYFTGLSNKIENTDRVSMSNNAKIARYPYIISSEKTKGFATSSGIYQADMDKMDSKVLKEAKVYYCLSDSGKGNYSVSPNDVRNNYYILRSDSVFYSGVTRKTFSSSQYLNEQKLFINTIVSAFGLERSIRIKVTNLPDYSSSAKKSYIMYADVDYDKDNTKVLSGYQDIEFTITKKGIKSDKINLKFYACNSDGAILDYNKDGKTDDNDSIKVSGTKVFKPDGSGTDLVKLKTDEAYTFKYPLEFLRGNGKGISYSILMKAEADGSAGSITDEAVVNVLRRSMFELD